MSKLGSSWIWITVLLHCLILSVRGTAFKRDAFTEIQRGLKKCCHPGDGQFDSEECTMWENMLDAELNRTELTRSRSYKYVRRLWKSMAKVTERLEPIEEDAIDNWTVKVSKPESVSGNTLTFESPRISNLTRLELVIPVYHIDRPPFCTNSTHKRGGAFITVDGKNVSSKSGTVPLRNLLVFRLPTSLTCDRKCSIDVHSDRHNAVIHRKTAMLLKYYYINETVINSIQNVSYKDDERRNSRNDRKPKESRARRAVDRELSNTASEEEEEEFQRKELKMKTRQRWSHNSGSGIVLRKSKYQKTIVRQNFCRLHTYRIDLRKDWRLNFIQEPRYINVGVCKGKCNALNITRADSYMTARSILFNLLSETPRRMSSPRPTCVPDKMLPTTILTMEGMEGGLATKNLLGAMIHSCRCV